MAAFSEYRLHLPCCMFVSPECRDSEHCEALTTQAERVSFIILSQEAS